MAIFIPFQIEFQYFASTPDMSRESVFLYLILLRTSSKVNQMHEFTRTLSWLTLVRGWVGLSTLLMADFSSTSSSRLILRGGEVG